MKQNSLLPNKYKKIGWFILIPSMLLGIYIVSTGFEFDWLDTKVFAIISDRSLSDREYFRVTDSNVTNTLTAVLCITGAMLVGFSREKIEDEFIAGIRLSSLLWAVGVNYILLLLALLFIYESPFMDVMVYNMFTILLLFIGRFNFVVYKNLKAVSDEK